MLVRLSALGSAQELARESLAEGLALDLLAEGLAPECRLEKELAGSSAWVLDSVLEKVLD